MASIQRIKSPLTGAITYRAQVRVRGHKAFGNTFPNKKEAEQWARSAEASIREGRHFPHLAGGKKSFGECVDRYLKSAVADHKDVETRRKHLARFEGFFIGKTVVEVTPDRVVEARDALAAESFKRGKDLLNDDGSVKHAARTYKRSGATVNRYMQTLHHMLEICKTEWRLIATNPASDISKKKESRGRIRFLSDQERDRLLEVCQQSGWDQLYPLVLLALTTGARRGELINLTWDAIDLKGSKALVTETKNDEPRVLPLVGKALEVLRELKLNGSARSEFVFPALSGFPGPYEHFDGYWRKARKDAGLQNFRFHDLRHSCASFLAANGATLLEIADVLGHKTLQMVQRYSHLTQHHKVSVIERMAKAQGL